ncbi:DUF6338 family protein [Granulicella arctica]|uniref:Uncharacterized protein n=1 Tax=Granulicella arctica TaxID=940613 RepID=A0A7Y9PE83_9BACT|nr:DUF6338 family protein [Granulicella arctica]NYF78286.1 hypothetical protein [Granulicella arctica]
MPTSIVALEILLILLPGFAAAYLVQLLALRGSQTDFDKVIEACLYSFLIYATYVLFTHGTLPFDVIPPKAPSTDYFIQWHRARLLGLAAITFCFAVGGAVYVNRDGNWLFQKLKLTERTARRSIWNDIFQREAKKNQVVQVELGDGRSILGLLSYYSDASEDCSVYVTQASWVDKDGNVIPIPGPGILITKNASIQSISLLDN